MGPLQAGCPLLPTLCLPLEAWLGRGSCPRFPPSSPGVTGSSEARAGGCLPGKGQPRGPCCARSVPTLGRTSFLGGTQGALCPAGGCRSSSTRRTVAWMCCSSTWPPCSALSRKPGPALVPPQSPCLPATRPLLGPLPGNLAWVHPGALQLA